MASNIGVDAFVGGARGALPLTGASEGAIATQARIASFVARAVGPRRQTAGWRERYGRRLWVSDLVVLAAVVYGLQWVGVTWGDGRSLLGAPTLEVIGWLVPAVFVAVWMWALSLIDSRSHRVAGMAATEYVRVADASFRLFGLLAILAFFFRIDLGRGFLLLAMPLGAVALVAERRVWRQWLLSQRRRGEYSARVLLIGSEKSVAHLARELARSPQAGYLVVGACVPSGKSTGVVKGTDIPLLGGVGALQQALAATSADTVAVTSTTKLPPHKVKQISWSLEAGCQHLVLAPSIIDIAGPRIHTRPVSGLPLIHVETPRFSTGQRLAKRAFDLTIASLALVILAPLIAIVAAVVGGTSPGGVLFRQQRVGMHGREFAMLKFRSMVSNAEDLLPELQAQRDVDSDVGNEVLFKMRNDPRVTPIGRILRKFSLDELPQLFNVMGGPMSLVGPRPPLLSEVEQYADHVHRRFLVKPGITGAWQVGGRSTLSWEDSVRLDLSYVENWTLVGDLVNLLKTARAAVAPGTSAV